MSYFKENEIDLIHGTCLTGHHGNLCNDCVLGYGKLSFVSECNPCNTNLVILVIRLISFALILVAYLLINARLLIDSDSQIIDVVSKICINHIQKISFVFVFNLKSLLDDIQDFFSFLNVLSFVNEDIFSNDCYLQFLFDTNENLYLYKVIITWCLPFVATFLCIIILKLFSCMKHIVQKKKDTHHLADRYMLMMFISIFIFYPVITKCSMTLMNCISLGGNEFFLYMSPNLQCWKTTHLIYFFSLGIFGMIIWGVLFPVFLYVMLKRNSLALAKAKVNNVISSMQRKKIKQTQSSQYLNFFYKDYRDFHYYWECVIFFQKFLLCILVNLNQFIGDEAETLLFYFILFVYLHYFVERYPFKMKQINNLEILSILISIGSKLLLFVSKYSSNGTLQVAFSVLILFY